MAGLLKQPRMMPPAPPSQQAAGQPQAPGQPQVPGMDQPLPADAGQPVGQSPDQPQPGQGPDPAAGQGPDQAGLLQPDQSQGASQADDNNPAFKAAMKFAMQALYQQGAADHVSEVLKKAPDVAEAMADTAYEMTSIVDEKTQSSVPDELLVLLASRILQEVADIAVASGVEVTPKIVADAFKLMVLRYVGDQGYDTRALQSAMDAVPGSDFEKLLKGGIGKDVKAPAQTPATNQPMGGA